MSYLLFAALDFDDFFFFHAATANRHAVVNLRGVALVIPLTDPSGNVFTNGQFESVLGPGDNPTIRVSVCVETVTDDELEADKSVDITLY